MAFTLIRLGFFGLALFASACAGQPQQVVLISVDTLRADHVGAQRNGVSITPDLDRLVTDAVRFDRAVSSSTVTLPAHASMLTGRHPWIHRARDNVGRVRRDLDTLPGILAARGFATGAVISSSPLGKLTAGFDFFDADFDVRDANRPNLRYKSAEMTSRVAEEWVAARGDTPFFLFVHYFPPHGPYTPPGDFVVGDRTSDTRLAISRRNYERGAIPAYQALPGIDDPATYRSRYEANVRYVDAHIGALLSGLKRLGVYEQCLIVVTADHGESLGEHEWFFVHGNLVYREQADVPFIVKLPGNGRAGSTESSPVQSVDVAPTILQVLGIIDAAPLDGLSVFDAREPRLVFTESTDAELRAVTDGPWKFTRHFGKDRLAGAPHPRSELYNLDTDPGELTNLVDSRPDQVRRLAQELRTSPNSVPTELSEPEPEELERLRSLGYIR